MGDAIQRGARPFLRCRMPAAGRLGALSRRIRAWPATAGTKLLQTLVNDDSARVRVPAYLDPCLVDFERAAELVRSGAITEAFVAADRKTMQLCRQLGFLPTYSCINYQTVSPPQFGEHLAWGDTAYRDCGQFDLRCAQQFRRWPVGAGLGDARQYPRPTGCTSMKTGAAICYSGSTANRPRSPTGARSPSGQAVIATGLRNGAGVSMESSPRPDSICRSNWAWRWPALVATRCFTWWARRRRPTPWRWPAAVRYLTKRRS